MENNQLGQIPDYEPYNIYYFFWIATAQAVHHIYLLKTKTYSLKE